MGSQWRNAIVAILIIYMHIALLDYYKACCLPEKTTGTASWCWLLNQANLTESTALPLDEIIRLQDEIP